ncbi:phage tail assembly chaperone [Pseudomonas guariconensis]|uniref:phage tail assembly chaperone n=1 Tax=Pseudomonas guariconensis TaxID=1288410 RepID=UPI003F69015F
MKKFYSASTRGFYSSEINGDDIPGDAVEITLEQHAALLEGEAFGLIIVANAQGLPVLQDRPLPTPEQLAVIERVWRDNELSASDRLIARHRDERDLARPLTLSEGQFSELLIYRQALRDWPASEPFPNSAQRPVTPSWVAEQTQ